MPEQHEMMLIGRTDSGAEQWQCPECGRSLLMRWPPSFESQVLEEGDPSALHQGVKGGVRMSRVQVDDERADLPDEDEQWLRRNGIDWHSEAKRD